MKLLLAIALVLALCAGALFWPVSGRSFWTRASERGLPQATARMAARGLRSAWDLVARHSAPPPPATHGVPAHSAQRLAAAPRKTPDTRSAIEPRGGPDHIVAQPPREKLGAQDRAGLEKLIPR